MSVISRGLGVLGNLVSRGLGWFMPDGVTPVEEPTHWVGNKQRYLRLRRAREEARMNVIHRDDDDWFILT